MPAQIALREVTDDDLPIFYEHQRDPAANAMAAFPPREREAFYAHWSKILHDPSCLTMTIVFNGHVAGNIGCWNSGGKHEVGYWIGRTDWGKGIATAALGELLRVVPFRPLFAHVVTHNAGSIRVLEKCGFRRVADNITADDDRSDRVEEIVLVLDR